MRRKNKIHCPGLLLMANIVIAASVRAQEKPGASAHDLALKLSNPVASLISVPLQSNIDYGMHNYHGSKYTLNFQPVVPFQLSRSVNLITRYIIPIVDQYDITAERSHQFGLSDATISAFISPVGSETGITWGAGPAFLVPIGTNDFLTTDKWGIGPTALILRQAKGFTYGLLVNQLWSFAGDENRNELNQMFLQPFFAYNWKSGAGLTINSEITFDWSSNSTTAFLNPIITGVTKLGKQAVSLGHRPKSTSGSAFR